MLARPHAYWGWLSVQPEESRQLMQKLLSCRDAAVAADPGHSGQPASFQIWCREEWLPRHIGKPFYRRQAEKRIEELGPKIQRLAEDAEKLVASLQAERVRLSEELELLLSVIEVAPE